MGQERLSGMAIKAIDRPIQKAIDIFADVDKSRRFKLN